jgi:hypothetical protein
MEVVGTAPAYPPWKSISTSAERVAPVQPAVSLKERRDPSRVWRTSKRRLPSQEAPPEQALGNG